MYDDWHAQLNAFTTNDRPSFRGPSSSRDSGRQQEQAAVAVIATDHRMHAASLPSPKTNADLTVRLRQENLKLYSCCV
jgi:hypothetical protein